MAVLPAASTEPPSPSSDVEMESAASDADDVPALASHYRLSSKQVRARRLAMEDGRSSSENEEVEVDVPLPVVLPAAVPAVPAAVPALPVAVPVVPVALPARPTRRAAAAARVRVGGIFRDWERSVPAPRRRRGASRRAAPTHSRQPPAPSPDELMEDTLEVGMRWGRDEEVPDSDDWMEPLSD